MTVEEKAKFEKMENSVERIQNDVSQIKQALLGNEFSGDKGLVGQINILRAEHEILKGDILKLREERIKNALFLKIIQWLVGVVVVGIVTFLFDKLK